MNGPRSLVVVGASAGGVEALMQFVGALPRDLGAAVAVVLHISPGGTSVLDGILDRAGVLPAVSAEDRVSLREGHVYVGPPDAHLLVGDDGTLRLDPGPRENGHRPAVDPLFRSAADAYGSRVIAVVLSGSRDDGTAGAAAVRAAGGRVAVQDPDAALYPSMPRSVLDRVGVDLCAPVPRLAETIAAWTAEPMSGSNGADGAERHTAGEPGSTGLTCPECGGAIYLDEPDGVIQLTCHTGHMYSPDSFADEQEREIEAALWGAVRRLDERGALLRRLGERIEVGNGGPAEFDRRASEAEDQARVIRDLIAQRVGGNA